MKFKLNGAKGNQRRKNTLKRLEAQLSNLQSIKTDTFYKTVRGEQKEVQTITEVNRVTKEIGVLKERIR
jgi:hypothetical protein